MALEDINLAPNYSTSGINPGGFTLPTPQASSWMSLIPYLSGGLSGLGGIFNLIQNIQRMRQLSDLRKFYRNWQQAANQQLSSLVGDAASRGLSGSPNALAGLVASSYAPFQLQSGQAIQSTIAPQAQPTNPFDTFLKSLEALRSISSKPSDTTLNFNPSSIRSGSLTDTPQPITLSPDFNAAFPQE